MANGWDVFRPTPSRDGRGHRAAVRFVVCPGCGGISFFPVFFSERTRPAAGMRPFGLIYLFTSNILFPTGLDSYQPQLPGMHLSALVTHDRAYFRPCSSSPTAFLRGRFVTLITTSYYTAVGYKTLRQYFHHEGGTALLRESHTLDKAETALFTSKASSLNKAVIVLWHTTAVIERPLL